MFEPGQSLRGALTAARLNRIWAVTESVEKISGTNGIQVSQGKGGLSFSLDRANAPVSTIQGSLVGGSAPSVTDGTTIIDLYAWAAYSITQAAFILSAGTTTLTVQVNGVSVSWLTALAITTTITVAQLPVPPTDLTHVIAPGDQLTIVLSGSSGTAAGLNFSLNCPF